MLFICTFTWAYTVCPCTAEAPALRACSKGTKTIKKRKKRRKNQKLSPEIGKFQSTNKHKREVMWICIVVLKTLHWWLAVLTHATVFKQCSSPLTERDQELKTIFFGHLAPDFLPRTSQIFTRTAFIWMSESKNIAGKLPTGPQLHALFLFLKKVLLLMYTSFVLVLSILWKHYS